MAPPQNGSDAGDEENTFRILVATDIHLGYAEKDALRGDDSFNSFEEILQIAVTDDVDFILLGGDLFHDGRPTVNAFDRCMSLLRHYCMGNRPIGVEFMSDPSEVFMSTADPCVNYMDPNLNVAFPIFSIHGNHDDPTGYNAKCSLDMLSAAGLVNYFGRQDNLNNVEIKPLLFRKGNSYVAIYGMGALKEKRLHKIISSNKVAIRKPPSTEEQKWFNIFVLHQNRAAHRTDEYVPESFLPKSMDLIVWGHEHECRLKPEFNEQQAFYVTQPGSSVATSLSEGESKPKYVGLLEVRDCKMRMLKRRLKTVRPFVFRSISLADSPVHQAKTTRMDIAVQRYLETEIESMLEEAQDQLTGHPKQPIQPLVRLKVEYETADQTFNLVRFGLQYQGQVANPNDLVMMKASAKKREPGIKNIIDEDAFQNVANLNLHTVEELVENYFKECDPEQGLQVLSVVGMNDAMTTYLSKQDAQAVDDLVAYQAHKTETYLIEKNVSPECLELEIEELRIRRMQQPSQEGDEIKQMLDNERMRERLRADYGVAANGDELGEPSTTRGRGRARRAAGTPRATRGRGRGAQVVSDDDGMDFEQTVEERPARGRGSRGGRTARAPRATRGSSRATASSQLDVSVSSSQRQAPPRRAAGGARNMMFIDDTDSD